MISHFELYRSTKHIIAAALLLLSTAASAADIRVIDGDTLEVDGTRVRLWGIDAPEMQQTCVGGYQAGVQASAALTTLLSSSSERLACDQVDIDRYGRVIAVCRFGDVDIAAELVRSGMAMDWPRHSNGAYSAAQATAVNSRRGIWAHRCMAPWQWRRH